MTAKVVSIRIFRKIIIFHIFIDLMFSNILVVTHEAPTLRLCDLSHLYLWAK